MTSGSLLGGGPPGKGKGSFIYSPLGVEGIPRGKIFINPALGKTEVKRKVVYGNVQKEIRKYLAVRPGHMQ